MEVMKHAVFFVLAVAAYVLQPVQLFAQSKKVSPHGVWQLSIPSSRGDEATVNFIPVWKIYYPDGQFAVMAWKSEKESAYITNHGTYTLEGDSVIVENVAYSSTNPQITGQQNRISTEYIGNDCMLAKLYVQSTGARWEELWKRMTQGEPSNPSAVFKGSKGENSPSQDANGVYHYTEQMPQFAGGDERAMSKYIQSQLSYPAEALAKGMEGVTMVRFVVNEDGKPQDFQIMHSSFGLLDNEALRVIKTLRFIPGRHNGKKVKVYLTVPVRFVLK